MFNATFLSFTLLSYNLLSPILTATRGLSIGQMQIQKSLFKNAFSTVVHSTNSKYCFYMEKVSFHNIMQTALYFQAEDQSLQGQVIKQQKIYNAVNYDVKITNCLFWNCKAKNNGGALFYDGWSNSFEMQGSTFVSCFNEEGVKHHISQAGEGGGGGGAAYLNCNSGVMKECCFQKCSGSDKLYGSAAMALANEKFTISQILCEDCKSETPITGPILWCQAYKTLETKNINITGGNSKECGALHYEYISQMLDTDFVTISNVHGSYIFDLSDIGAYYDNQCNNGCVKPVEKNIHYNFSHYTFISNQLLSTNSCIILINLLNSKNLDIEFSNCYFYEAGNIEKTTLFHHYNSDNLEHFSLKFSDSYIDLSESHTICTDSSYSTENIQTIKRETTSTITIGEFNCIEPPTDSFSPSGDFSQSPDFTNSAQFSLSSDFSKSFDFSSSKYFSCSFTFTVSETFTSSTDFTNSAQFSLSSDFSKSFDFSSSKYFSFSFTFTVSETFTSSTDLTKSTQFTISSDFTLSNSFTPFVSDTESSSSSTSPPLNVISVGQVKSKNELGTIIGIVICVLVIIALVIILIMIIKKRLEPELASGHEMTESSVQFTQANEIYTPNAQKNDDPFAGDFDAEI